MQSSTPFIVEVITATGKYFVERYQFNVTLGQGRRLIENDATIANPSSERLHGHQDSTPCVPGSTIELRGSCPRVPRAGRGGSYARPVDCGLTAAKTSSAWPCGSTFSKTRTILLPRMMNVVRLFCGPHCVCSQTLNRSATAPPGSDKRGKFSLSASRNASWLARSSWLMPKTCALPSNFGRASRNSLHSMVHPEV